MVRPLDGSADLSFGRDDFLVPSSATTEPGSYLSYTPVENGGDVHTAKDLRPSSPEQWHRAERQFNLAPDEPELHPTIDHTFGLGAEKVTIPLVLTAAVVGGALLYAVV